MTKHLDETAGAKIDQVDEKRIQQANNQGGSRSK